MSDSNQNFAYILNGNALKPLSVLTENLSFSMLDNLLVQPKQPKEFADFFSVIDASSLPYSPTVQTEIQKQIATYNAFIFCINNNFTPIFNVHDPSNGVEFKIPILNEHNKLEVADYNLTMFDLTANVSPRFLLNFNTDSNVKVFLYNFSDYVTKYLRVLDRTSKEQEAHKEEFDNYCLEILENMYVQNYLSLCMHMLVKNEDVKYHHSDQQNDYFTHIHKNYLFKFPLTKQETLTQFKVNFDKTIIDLDPNTEFFNSELERNTTLYLNLKRSVNLDNKNIILNLVLNNQLDNNQLISHDNEENVKPDDILLVNVESQPESEIDIQNTDSAILDKETNQKVTTEEQSGDSYIKKTPVAINDINHIKKDSSIFSWLFSVDAN